MSGLAVEAAPGHARIAGTLGYRTPVGALRDAGRAVADAARGGVATVDVSGLDGADSATLAILLAWAARARRHGTGLRYAGLPGDLDVLARLADATQLLDRAP